MDNLDRYFFLVLSPSKTFKRQSLPIRVPNQMSRKYFQCQNNKCMCLKVKTVQKVVKISRVLSSEIYIKLNLVMDVLRCP